MCILLGVLGMFQLEFFNNLQFWPFYSNFKIKSSENSCKNVIFAILSKIAVKTSKTQNCNVNRMQLVSGRYVYYVMRNCNFRVQIGQVVAKNM